MVERAYITDWRSPRDGEFKSAVAYELLEAGFQFSETAYPAGRARCRVVITADEAAHAFVLTIPGVSEEA